MGSKHVGRKPGDAEEIDVPSGQDLKAPQIVQVESEEESMEGIPDAEKMKRMTILEKERLLKQAVKEENYTEAAKLRDEIQLLKGEEDKK